MLAFTTSWEMFHFTNVVQLDSLTQQMASPRHPTHVPFSSVFPLVSCQHCLLLVPAFLTGRTFCQLRLVVGALNVS